jgi:uncharacterized protein with ATP-grasp and redox domains
MINPDCVPCFRKQASRLFEKCGISAERQSVLYEELDRFLAREGSSSAAPLSGQYLNQLVKRETGKLDLYLEEKQYYNRLILERLPRMRKEVEGSSDPLETALRYALAGNIIDFGPPHAFNLESTLGEALTKTPAIDHSRALFAAVGKAKTVLYLGDNAGEIVTDRLFIEALGHPNVIFAVRGQPVLNDVTALDAHEVGMHEVATVIDNGFDAPSTLLPYCSEAFIKVFEEADVVISKGQGNFEGLWDEVEKENLFFMFMVKCDAIARATGTHRGDAVVMVKELL